MINMEKPPKTSVTVSPEEWANIKRRELETERKIAHLESELTTVNARLVSDKAYYIKENAKLEQEKKEFEIQVSKLRSELARSRRDADGKGRLETELGQWQTDYKRLENMYVNMEKAMAYVKSIVLDVDKTLGHLKPDEKLRALQDSVRKSVVFKKLEPRHTDSNRVNPGDELPEPTYYKENDQKIDEYQENPEPTRFKEDIGRL